MSSVVEFTADSLFSVPVGLQITETSLYPQNQLIITINQQELEYPTEWLRFKCQCKSCFNPTTLSYKSQLETIIYGSRTLTTVKPTQNGKAIDCVWEDGHTSSFTAEWLYIRRFTKEGLLERNRVLFSSKPESWQDDLVVEKATYDQVTDTASGFEHFGESLIRDGIFLITAAPDRFVATEFCKKIGSVVFETHYGKHFTVINEAKPNNLAYTNCKLELHVDQPFLTNCPDIQYLHCLTPAAEGGENVMADGIKAANLLRERHPKHYQTLRDTRVSYEDIISLPGHTHQYIINNKPVINENEDGEVAFLQFNSSVLSSFFNGSSPSEFTAWMEAIKEFYKIYSHECSVTIKTEAGDILVFDNQRVMHAREAYSTSHTRKLEGFYTNWDFILSRLRVAKLKRRQQTNEMDKTQQNATIKI